MHEVMTIKRVSKKGKERNQNKYKRHLLRVKWIVIFFLIFTLSNGITGMEAKFDAAVQVLNTAVKLTIIGRQPHPILFETTIASKFPINNLSMI